MPRMRELRIRAIAAAFAALFFVGALVFLVFAGYLVLRAWLDPEWAALAAGSACLLVAGLIPVAARLVVRRGAVAQSTGQGNPADAIEGLLEEAIDDALLGAWIRRHPDAAAAVSVLLGVAAGYSHSVRCVLHDIWMQRSDGGRASRRR